MRIYHGNEVAVCGPVTKRGEEVALPLLFDRTACFTVSTPFLEDGTM